MNDMERWLREREITEVECLVADLNGIARGKILPDDQVYPLARRGHAAPARVVFVQTVTGEYASEDRVTDPALRDVRMRPDARSLRVVPWYQEPTAQVISDCYHHDGEPVAIAPRQVLRKVLQAYADRGWRPVVAPELEFFLTQDQRAIRTTRWSRRSAARGRPQIGAPGLRHRRGQRVRSAVRGRLRLLRGAGDRRRHPDPRERRRPDGDQLQPRRSAGAGRPGVPVQAHACARRRSSTTSTPPSWPSRWSGEPGSAMHIHQSVVDLDTGAQHVRGQGRRLHRAVPASTSPGCRSYLPAAMPLLAPYVNSYRRLRRHSAAPINLQWGWENRTVGLRVPISDDGRAPGREPRHRRRRQSLSGDRGLARLRPARHDRRARADQADRGQRLPPGPDPAAAHLRRPRPFAARPAAAADPGRASSSRR